MINPMQSPCYKCDKREMKCHVWCEAYAEFKRIRTDYHEKERNYANTSNEYVNTIKGINYKLTSK